MKILQSTILILGSIALYAQPGELDITFGSNGKTITNFANYSSELNSIAFQSDGKIVVAGTAERGMGEIIIAARYLSDGQLDESFGDTGKFEFRKSAFSDRCFAMTTDDSDNIFLAGLSVDSDFNSNAILLKLLKNGKIDSTFATNGVWQNSEQSDDVITDILVTSNNNLLMTGGTSENILTDPLKFLLIQLNPDGTCLLYTSPSPRDGLLSRMPSSA